MNLLNRWLTECEFIADSLTEKLRKAAFIAEVHDAHAHRRLTDMANWISDIGDELAALAGHPRDIPDYHDEANR